MSLIRIVGPEPAFPDILKEIPFARVLPRKLPWRLIESIRIAIRIYKNPKSLLHRCIIQPKHVSQMKNIPQIVAVVTTTTIDAISALRGRAAGGAIAGGVRPLGDDVGGDTVVGVDEDGGRREGGIGGRGGGGGELERRVEGFKGKKGEGE